ncbi:hypothetical protein [Gelidibacter japonicus]|uniref:hypothetical protein n=1 Tax=Gelidibacter japonicus TaxID=1962232 RepID=UPI002B0022BB|nr:hypothetical protein [Gelidibacter japonicus]
MKNVSLSPITIAEISTTFINQLKEEGLVLMPEKFSPAVALVYAKRKKLLAQKTVTPYQIEKYGLLNDPVTADTIKNMIKDGRITDREAFIDAKGHHQVMTTAIKRLNKT